MPSTFTLVLDTRPPSVWLGDAVLMSGTLRVPYAVDEPGIKTAVAVPEGQGPIPAQITSEYLLFDLGGRAWTAGVVQVEVEDEVGNAATHSAAVSFSTVRYYEATAEIMPDPAGGWRPRYFTEVCDPYDEPILPPMRGRGKPPARR